MGLNVNEYVRAKLYLLHMPNVNSGYSFRMPNAPTKRSREEKAEEEIFEAAMTVTTVQKDEVERKWFKVHSKVMSAAAAATKVITLEIWSGDHKYMSVRWGRTQPFRGLLSALVVVRARPGHHLILMTTTHRIAGKGCIRSIDTPCDLAMPRGGTLSMNYLSQKPETSPAFIPHITVEWSILKQKGVHVWENKHSRLGISRRVRSRGSSTGEGVNNAAVERRGFLVTLRALQT